VNGLTALRRTTLVPVVLVALVVASCGGDDDAGVDTVDRATTSTEAAGAPTSVTSPPTTVPAETVTAETEPPETSSTSTSSTTSTSTSTSTSTTAPTTTVPEGALDAACLQGQWLLDDAATAALHSALLPGFPLVVEGSQQLTFSGDTVEYFINEVLRFGPAGVDVSIPFDQRSAGTYVIEGETIVMNYDTVEGGVGGASGTVSNSKGELTDVAGQFIPPDFELPNIGGGPATCDDTTLTIGVTSGLADATAVFTKIA
jgi:hypothetical protein